MNKNFKTGDKVEFHSTASTELDGKAGELLGIASAYPENNYWIVLLDEPLPERKAVVITDSCIHPAEAKEPIME